MQPGVATRRPVTATVSGAFLVLCAVAAGTSMAVTDRMLATDGPGAGWRVLWPLLLTLAAAGSVVMRDHRRARPAAAVAAIVAAQVVVVGMTAIRDWFTYDGLRGLERHSLVAMLPYAVGVVLAAPAATVTAVALVWREPVGGCRRWRRSPTAVAALVTVVASVALFLVYAVGPDVIAHFRPPPAD